ncbi:hypothetical protein WME95_38170 [Sorangium sp. So ce327]|uniref:hypothetical protein n=1 Tax=Sorangium sp. So ce327 TaxID=3133301 RepID=UPI003F635ACD
MVVRRAQLLQDFHKPASAVQLSVVPDVDMDGVKIVGEATIYVCLFSRVWTWVDP